jgi:two-component system, sensor histidine kinase and response regulator
MSLSRTFSSISSKGLSSEDISKSSRLLAVDDLPDNLSLMDAILGEEDGYELMCLSSAKAALEAIEASPPDLVLLDVMMPEMTGYEVARCIRQNPELPYIPILLVSAHDELNATASLDTGVDGFIRKPIDVEELLERVRSLLSARQSVGKSSSQPSVHQLSNHAVPASA